MTGASQLSVTLLVPTRPNSGTPKLRRSRKQSHSVGLRGEMLLHDRGGVAGFGAFRENPELPFNLGPATRFHNVL